MQESLPFSDQEKLRKTGGIHQEALAVRPHNATSQPIRHRLPLHSLRLDMASLVLAEARQIRRPSAPKSDP